MSKPTGTIRVPYGTVLSIRAIRGENTDAAAVEHIVEHYRTCTNAGNKLGGQGTVKPNPGESNDDLSLTELLTTKKIRVYRDDVERLERWRHEESNLGNALAHAVAHYRACNRANRYAPPGPGEDRIYAFLPNNAGFVDDLDNDDDHGRPVVG